MKPNTVVCIAGMAFLTATAVLLTGCASSGHKKGESTSSGLQAAADRIAQAQGTRGAVLAALNDLVTQPQPDLRPQFKKFTSLLNRWEKEVQDVQSKSADMQAKGASYFKSWDEDLAKIQNEDIRSRSLARKAEVSKQFEKIKAGYAAVDEARRPLMADLADIRTALSADLTRAGLEAVKPVVTKANADAEPLQKAVDQLVNEFKALGVAMSAVAPQPAK